MRGGKPDFRGIAHGLKVSTKVKGKGFFEFGFRIADVGERNIFTISLLKKSIHQTP
jgi:hypothetical protein